MPYIYSISDPKTTNIVYVGRANNVSKRIAQQFKIINQWNRKY